MKQAKKRLSLYCGFAEEIRAYGIEEAARRSSERGFSTVEMLETAKEPQNGVIADVETARRAKEILERYGLSLSCYSLLARLWTPGMTKEYAAWQDARIRHFASIAAALGSPFLHHTLATVRDETPYGAVLETVVSRAIPHVDYAASLGLTVLYEPQGPYFNGCEGFGTLYRTVKAERPSIGICGDVGNTVFVNEDPAPFFSEFAREMRHVHLKNYYLNTDGGDVTRNGTFVKDAAIGDGELDLAPCITALREANYSGAFAIESKDPRSIEQAEQLLKTYFFV